MVGWLGDGGMVVMAVRGGEEEEEEEGPTGGRWAVPTRSRWWRWCGRRFGRSRRPHGLTTPAAVDDPVRCETNRSAAHTATVTWGRTVLPGVSVTWRALDASGFGGATTTTVFVGATRVVVTTTVCRRGGGGRVAAATAMPVPTATAPTAAPISPSGPQPRPW